MPERKKLYQRLLLGGKFILQRCVFELYYPVNNDRYEMILELLEKNRTNMMEEQFFIFGSYVESIYGNSEINRYQQWLENNGSEENKALILYLRAVWEVAKDEYDLFNETALKYARESLECDKDVCDLSKCPSYDFTCVQGLIISMSIHAFDFSGAFSPRNIFT